MKLDVSTLPTAFQAANVDNLTKSMMLFVIQSALQRCCTGKLRSIDLLSLVHVTRVLQHRSILLSQRGRTKKHRTGYHVTPNLSLPVDA
jgi:hypothetical protein